MAEFQETGQEPMEVDGANCVSEGNVNDVDMETGSQANGDDSTPVVSPEATVASSNDKVEDVMKESDISGTTITKNTIATDQSQAEQSEVLKGHDDLSQDDDDQGGSSHAVTQASEDQSSLKEVSGSDQKSPQDDQEDPVNPEGTQPLGNKPEQTNQSSQSGNDHEGVDDQMEATSQQDDPNPQNASSDQDKVKTDRDKVNTDQDEEPPSTPPHMTNPSADSQATEIIGSDSSHGNQASGSDGDDEHNGHRSSEDEAESQYGRPWYKFWGSSDTQAKKRKITITRKPSVWSARDTLAYRDGYPGKRDNKRIDKNLKFYRNQIPSYPYGDYIDVIHEKWWNDHQHLEYNHSYIQWLFPIREQGLNMHAEVLQLHEAEAICSDPAAHGRILKSYKMMLGFYGMRMCDEETGELERAENWKERFRHLNHSMHNYLRITRILKCLGEMQLEHLKAPFVRYVLYEIISEQTLYNCLDSCINYWLQVIKDDQEREDLLEYAESLARETRSTTTTAAKSQAAAAEGETKKNTETKPAKETKPVKKETQPAKKETKPVKETQPAEKETKPMKETQPAKKETKPMKETQPAEKETKPMKETQPANRMQSKKAKQQDESQAQQKKQTKLKQFFTKKK